MAEQITPEVLLVLLDVAIFAVLAAGLFALRRVRPPVVNDVRDAFQVLDRTIVRFASDFPPGFTWGEALERLKAKGIQADWPKLESSLADYEAFRYGGRDLPPGKGDDVIELSKQVRGGLIG